MCSTVRTIIFIPSTGVPCIALHVLTVQHHHHPAADAPITVQCCRLSVRLSMTIGTTTRRWSIAIVVDDDDGDDDDERQQTTTKSGEEKEQRVV